MNFILNVILVHHRECFEVIVNERWHISSKNHLKECRMHAGLSKEQLADMVGVSRNTISTIETGKFQPTAKLALVLCIALDKKFEELFYFYFVGFKMNIFQI